MPGPDLILVTGATGNIGSSLAKHLERLGKQFRLLARKPDKLSDFPNADKVKGDYSDVASLSHAFTGVSSAFIVSGYAEPGERAKLHRNASKLRSEPASATSSTYRHWEHRRTLVSQCHGITTKASDI